MSDYFSDGERKAYALPNRGPLKFTSDGNLDPDILAAYWRYGFYVLEGAVGADEVKSLVKDFESMMARAPTHQGADVDAQGEPSIDYGFESVSFKFAKPLSDPMGATDRTGGRYPVKMTEFEAPSDGPEEVLLTIGGSMQIMETNLRLYGHPKLLRLAESINGPDFVPFKEAVWVKPAHYGAAVSWHQDGTTHWENPNLDAGTHGFNFMAQLYPTNPMNALWIIPESHDKGKADIKKLIMENGGSDKLPGAVPLLGAAGDIAICSRQMLHCSFPNTSHQTRVTYVFGFHRRASVQGVEGWDVGDKQSFCYDDERIHRRSRVIQLAIDARRQCYPEETPYVYRPMGEEADLLRWSDETRETVLRNYNQLDLGI